MRLAMLAVLFASRSVLADPAREAADQLRDRLQTQWQVVVDADKSFGWMIETRATHLAGDWVVRLSGWTYFFARGAVVCRIQGGQHLTCDNEHWTSPGKIAVLPARRAPTLTELRTLQRGVFGAELPIARDGTAVLETIVSTPNAPARTSWRYRANATVTARGFTIEAPVLVESYRETCMPTHGCHDTYWYCTRIK